MFDNNFEAVLADTETARRIHHHIRYQVYCLEEGFEDPGNFPDREEHDDWDDHSVHFLVRSKSTNEWVAAMRLVLPSQQGFPLEQLCDIDPAVTPTVLGDSVVEVSRLCIVNNYRRAQQQGMHYDANGTIAAFPRQASEEPESVTMDRRQRSDIVMGLMRAAAAYCREKKIANWYFLSTPAFGRMMNRLGFQLVKLGAAVEHRGKRLPFLISPLAAYDKVTRDCCSSMAAMLRRRTAYLRYSELDFCLPDQTVQRSLVA
jgi:N-acyl amino acid synthase of PEP-CTERM/exosortase system